MDRTAISFEDCLRGAFGIWKDNLLLLLPAALIAVCLSVVTAGLLAGPLLAGLAGIALGLIDRRDPAPLIGDLYRGFTYIVPSFVLTTGVWLVIAALNLFLGLIPVVGWFAGPICLFLGAVAGTIAAFALLDMIDRDTDLAAAVQSALGLVRQQFWMFMGIYLLAAVIASAGCLFTFATLPYGVLLLASAYRSLRPAPPR